MSTVPPSSGPGALLARLASLGPRQRAAVFVGGAFAIGLLLFLLLWLDQRNDREFYQAGRVHTPLAGPGFEPLPGPMPGSGSATGLSEGAEAARAAQEEARKRAAAAPPPAPTPAPAPSPAREAESRPITAESTRTDVPVPVSRPAPSYPIDALRRRDEGTVVVRIEVDEEGKVDNVRVLSRSGSRELDRAAVQAAKRWTFRPAMRDGRPVPGAVEAPITFSLGGR